MNIERRPSQPAEMGPCVLALPFRIHSPQFQVFKECAEVQGSTESTVAERRARSDFAVKSSRIAFLCFFFSLPPMRVQWTAGLLRAVCKAFSGAESTSDRSKACKNSNIPRQSYDKSMLLHRTVFKSRLEGALGGRLRLCQ